MPNPSSDAADPLPPGEPASAAQSQPAAVQYTYVASTAPASSAVDVGGRELATATPRQTIDELIGDRDEQPRLSRRWRLTLLLFIATCVTTFFAGVYQWQERWLFFGEETWAQVRSHWQDGLTYMLAVMGILLAHEMGHFLMALRYGIPASYPIFIPVPVTILGTMGAVIAMDGRRADRRQMFDIGLAGPLAGLVVAIPVLCVGILTANLEVPRPGMHVQGDPLLAEFLITWLRPDAASGAEVLLVNRQGAGNPLYMAGWVGMLITGLNMMPISQLDGGHVLYALFGRRAHFIARAFLLSVIGWMILADNYKWIAMVIVVTLIGTDHPPTANDGMPLGRWRYALGLLSLAIPVLCFIPNPF
jgi:membrane-associated protease RseP (regulator of RpoE activity)